MSPVSHALAQLLLGLYRDSRSLLPDIRPCGKIIPQHVLEDSGEFVPVFGGGDRCTGLTQCFEIALDPQFFECPGMLSPLMCKRKATQRDPKVRAIEIEWGIEFSRHGQSPLFIEKGKGSTYSERSMREKLRVLTVWR